MEVSKAQAHDRETRLKRLADNIDRLADKDAESLRHAREVAALRRAAAA